MEITSAEIAKVLTRSSGFLTTVSSHSLQPYRGCALGRSLCGVGCYVQHNIHLTRGQPWGSFVEVRANAPESYQRQYEAERDWARRKRGRFGIFMSSSTEPFQPIEKTARVTQRLLESMIDRPPELLILQTHSHHVVDYIDLYPTLSQRCEMRVHLSIETDRNQLPGLPPAASPVAKRIAAAAALRSAGIRVVITVAQLLPIAEPDSFFANLAEVADAVVIDHYIGGDGSPAPADELGISHPSGSRTLRTSLPQAMAAIEPRSVLLAYRDEIVNIARKYFPGKVGVNIDGFAGKMLPG